MAASVLLPRTTADNSMHLDPKNITTQIQYMLCSLLLLLLLPPVGVAAGAALLPAAVAAAGVQPRQCLQNPGLRRAGACRRCGSSDCLHAGERVTAAAAV